MKGTLLFRAAALTGLASAAFFLAQSASADTISVSDAATIPSVPLTVSTSSTGSVVVEDFTVTNTTTTKTTKNNSHSVDIDSIDATIGAHSDNPLDFVTSVTDTGGTCVAGTTNLLEGQSCTIDLTIDYTAGAPDKGHHNPFGSNEITLEVDGTNPQGAVGNKADDTQKFKVTADYVAPTPEPGSLLLLGTGMLGLAGVVRRKLRRS
jgi:hypothetical protein